MSRKERNQTDRILFNGHDLSTLVSCEIQRPVFAPTEIKTINIPGKDGEMFDSIRRQPYDLPVKMWLRVEDRYAIKDVRQKLSEALWTDEPQPLYLPDDPTRYLLAVVTGSTWLDEMTDVPPCVTVNFRVLTPDYFGRKRIADVYWPDRSSVFIDTGGNRPTYPKITVKITSAQLGGWNFRNKTTGEQLSVVGPFHKNDIIEIDMEKETAFCEGRQLKVTLDSDYFSIFGRAELTCSSGEARVEWRERWL